MELDLALYVARLQAELDGWSQVGDAADLAAVEDGPVTTPSLFLVPLADAPVGNAFAGDFTQHVVGRYGAVIAVSNQSDARGSAAASELVTRRREVREALAAWSPGDGIGYSQRGPGSLVKFADGVLWWMDEYMADWYERKA